MLCTSHRGLPEMMGTGVSEIELPGTKAGADAPGLSDSGAGAGTVEGTVELPMSGPGASAGGLPISGAGARALVFSGQRSRGGRGRAACLWGKSGRCCTCQLRR